MSQASDFKDMARDAKDIYEVVGNSGASYVFFWFTDGSVCAARRLPGRSALTAARFEFQETKVCLDDCGLANFQGSTYQMGAELLRRIKGA